MASYLSIYLFLTSASENTMKRVSPYVACTAYTALCLQPPAKKGANQR